MKKLILLELALLFLATTFQSDNPPGWYQQTLPVNDNINDIFFLDSLNGWVVTNGGSNDTAYIMKTVNGGDNWSIQKDSAGNLYTVQFLDTQNGYASGRNNHGIIYKTTNSGVNWNLIFDFSPVGNIDNMSFVNNDTGWACSEDPFDGGVFKTTDGGLSWLREFNYGVDNPDRIFFINSDTGWTSNGSQRKLYKTINGGMNWNLQYTHISQINDIYFINGNIGILTEGVNYRTTNGGFNWYQSIGNVGGIKISIGNDSIGWAGANFNKISKTTNNGVSWGIQSSPLFNNSSAFAIDSLKAWAGGNGLVRTTDGGGLVVSVKQNSMETPSGFKLYQNYPNPFNPKTKINYEIKKSGFINLTVYDIRGSKISVLINKRQSSGNYEMEFDGSNLNSGVYFYKILVTDEKSNDVFSETKNMLLVK